jgi:hypothetical protein
LYAIAAVDTWYRKRERESTLDHNHYYFRRGIYCYHRVYGSLLVFSAHNYFERRQLQLPLRPPLPHVLLLRLERDLGTCVQLTASTPLCLPRHRGYYCAYGFERENNYYYFYYTRDLAICV